MKYVVLFLIALIATTFAAPTCSNYCTMILANCNGTNAQYPGMTECMASCALFPLGADADTSQNSVGCRTYHAGAAASDANTHCIHAGPTGGDACGNVCEGYCNLTVGGCTGANLFYPTWDMGFCMKACPLFNMSSPATPKAQAGPDVHCHAYHAGVASQSTANGNTHCAHAAPAGVTVCGSVCENYCSVIMASCTGTDKQYNDMAQCMSYCSTLPVGMSSDISGNSQSCRLYHAMAGTVIGPTHCPHASHSGGGVCGSLCEAYCSTAASSCTGSMALYTDNAACMTACAGIASTTGKPGDTSGDNIYCRIYHLGAAKADPTTHCAHGKVQSATCGGIPTTSATKTETKTGNAFGIVVSFVTLIGFLLF
jgi:hypothetical protein